MQRLISRLDVWLRSNRASYYAQLLPGATDEEIKRLEQSLNLSLPESFKVLYRWHNGQLDDFFEAFHDNKMFLSIQEIEKTWIDLKELLEVGDFEIEHWWCVGWVPFMHDGGGNYLCLDLEGTFTGKKGQLLEFWHDDYSRDVLYPSFEDYLEILVQYFEKKVWQKDEDSWIVEKDYIRDHKPGYPKRIFLD